jgi:RNA polymerase sigma factor (sigma-70 family)
MILAETASAPTCAADSRSMGHVYVIDDDITMRDALETLISHEGFVVETFENAERFLTRPRTLEPSCLVLDYSLPEVNGLVVQERMSSERPEIPIIFITGYANVPITIRALKSGAIEFLTKPFSDDALLAAITTALDRSRAFLENEAESEMLRSCYASLTPRERDVFALISAGMSNKRVGSHLGISVITVKTHRGKVMRKMNARTLADLVRMAGRLLVPTHPPVKRDEIHKLS